MLMFLQEIIPVLVSWLGAWFIAFWSIRKDRKKYQIDERPDFHSYYLNSKDQILADRFTRNCHQTYYLDIRGNQQIGNIGIEIIFVPLSDSLEIMGEGILQVYHIRNISRRGFVVSAFRDTEGYTISFQQNSPELYVAANEEIIFVVDYAKRPAFLELRYDNMSIEYPLRTKHTSNLYPTNFYDKKRKP